MGPKQSKQVTLEDNTKVNHPLFENSKIIVVNDQNLISIDMAVASEKQFKSWQALLQRAPSNDSLFLPIECSFTKQGYCGSSGLVNLRFPNFPYLLIDQIKNRSDLSNKTFLQIELWYLAYTLLSAASQVHQKGHKLGDVRPNSIFINDEGQVKVATLYSWPNEQTNYSKAFFDKETTYLAPQQIKQMQFGKMEPNSDYQLAQTFSIGLTLLDACNLSSSTAIYGKNNKFDYQKLQESLAKFQTSEYSEAFEILIRNMCEIEASQRHKCIELYNWLKPYQESIVNLEDFQIKGIPQKLLKTHQRHQLTLTVTGTPTKQPNSVNISPDRPPTRDNFQKRRPQQIQKRRPQEIQTMIRKQVPPANYLGNYYNSQLGVQPSRLNTTQIPIQPYYTMIRPQPPRETYKVTNSYMPMQIKKQSGINLSKIDQQLQLSRKMFP